VKYQAFYSATGIDPPEVVKFIRIFYPEVRFLYPAMSFWKGVETKFPPRSMTRWCCDVLKKKPAKRHPLGKHRIVGIRAEESSKRKGIPRIDRQLLKPIFEWKEWHVWDFIEQQALPYPSLYDEGFNRLGCIICPFNSHKSMKGHLRNMVRWPKYFEIFEKVVERWVVARWVYDKQVRKYDSPKAYIEAWYRGFE
jgi:phosphoadenosine phosphosulfate reductase